MALQLPQYLKSRSPEYLYQLLKLTHERQPQVVTDHSEFGCSQRPYGLEVCHGSSHNGIRYGTFGRCKWFGMMCSNGHFYSKVVVVNGQPYQLRAGVFTDGHEVKGKYGVTLLDGSDSRFVAQLLTDWVNTQGDEALLTGALNQVCVPIRESFSRTLYKSVPPSSEITAEMVTSTLVIESGTRVYCEYSAPSENLPSSAIIPQLASWWQPIFESIMAHFATQQPPFTGNETAALN